jgi:hypothetical protein
VFGGLSDPLVVLYSVPILSIILLAIGIGLWLLLITIRLRGVKAQEGPPRIASTHGCHEMRKTDQATSYREFSPQPTPESVPTNRV